MLELFGKSDMNILHLWWLGENETFLIWGIPAKDSAVATSDVFSVKNDSYAALWLFSRVNLAFFNYA